MMTAALFIERLVFKQKGGRLYCMAPLYQAALVQQVWQWLAMAGRDVASNDGVRKEICEINLRQRTLRYVQ